MGFLHSVARVDCLSAAAMRRLEEWPHIRAGSAGTEDRTRLIDSLATFFLLLLAVTDNLPFGRRVAAFRLLAGVFMFLCALEELLQRGMKMSVIDRAKNILLNPKTEWDVIAKEATSVGGLFSGYACILALIPAIAAILFTGLLGLGLGGMGAAGGMMAGLGMSYWVTTALVGYFVGLGLLWLVAFIVKAVSPSFNGSSDMVQATKLMVYAATPTWVVGLVSWIPVLGWVLSLAAMAYAVYLIYLGVRPVLDVPQEKVAGMTVVTILVYIVASVVIGGIVAAAIIGSMFSGAMMAGSEMM